MVKVASPRVLHTRDFQYLNFSNEQFEDFEAAGNISLEHHLRKDLERTVNRYIEIQNSKADCADLTPVKKYLGKLLKAYTKAKELTEKGKTEALSDPAIRTAWSLINSRIYEEEELKNMIAPPDYMVSQLTGHQKVIEQVYHDLVEEYDGKRGPNSDDALKSLFSEMAEIFICADGDTSEGGLLKLGWADELGQYNGDFAKFINAVHSSLPKEYRAHSEGALNKQIARMIDPLNEKIAESIEELKTIFEQNSEEISDRSQNG